MNPMDFSCLAGHAIQKWSQNNVEGCILTVDGFDVFCCKIPKERKTYRAALCVSAFEVKHGMKSARWNFIGAALHEIYLKESKCRTHQKH